MISEAAAEIIAALEAAGLRIATKSGDITPPVIYLQVGQATDAAADAIPIAGALMVTFYVHYIPIRGIDNFEADAAGLDRLYAALRPLAVGPLVATRSSVTVFNETWPCYRADLPALALDPAEVS